MAADELVACPPDLLAHRCLARLTDLFGSTLLYRLPDRSTIVASLDRVTRINAGGGDVHARVEDLLDRYEQESRASATADGVGDVVVALSHDLQWALRDPGLSGPPPAAKPDGPVAVVALTATTVRFTPGGAVYVAGADARRARQVLVDAAADAPNPLDSEGQAGLAPLTDMIDDIDERRYVAALGMVQEEFSAGESYQTVLSVGVRVRPRSSLTDYFAAVAQRYRGCAYSYWFDAEGCHFFGNCSLPHVEWRGNRLSTRVFAGTAPAARSPEELARTRAEMNTEKYFSEHVMLVDLERSDLGAIALPDSVRTGELLVPHVVGPTTYLGTEVTADVPNDLRLAEVLLTSFPRGVAIGTPKARTQEIIARLEGRPRGFYTGVLGIFQGNAGELISNTIVTCGLVQPSAAGPEVRLDVAGGLVAGSDPDQELRELRLKLRYTV